MKQSKSIKKIMASLFRSSVFNFLSQITIFLSATLLSIFLARFLGPVQMGEYSYLMWLVSTLSILLTLGLPRTVMRFAAGSKGFNQTQIISRTLIFQLKTAVIAFLAGLIGILLFGGGQKFTLLVVLLTLLIATLNLLTGSILSGLQKFNLLFKINLLVSPLLLIFSLLVLFFAKSITNLLFVNLLSIAFSLGVSIYFLKDLINLTIPKLPHKIYRNIKGNTISISLIVFLDLILMERSEVFFLKNYSTIEQVAFYSISFGLVGRVMTLVPGAVSGVIMPKVSFLHGKSQLAKIKLTYFNSTRYLILITMPIIFAGIALIDLIINLLYGSEYNTLIPIIQILLISGGLSAIVAAAAAVLYGTGGQSFILKLASIAAILNIILDMLFIPDYGAIGAALANFIAQILGVIVGTYYLIKKKQMPFPWKDLSKVLVAALISTLQICFLKVFFIAGNKIIFLFWLSSLFILSYVLVLYLLKTLNKQDYDLIKRVANSIGFKV